MPQPLQSLPIAIKNQPVAYSVSQNPTPPRPFLRNQITQILCNQRRLLFGEEICVRRKSPPECLPLELHHSSPRSSTQI
ncbi:hypothetical protein ACFX12_038977 [Malus domestica]